jgi:hypothetical protein
VKPVANPTDVSTSRTPVPNRVYFFDEYDRACTPPNQDALNLVFTEMQRLIYAQATEIQYWKVLTGVDSPEAFCQQPERIDEKEMTNA